MNKKKSFVLRYDQEIQEKIDKLADIAYYTMSKNKGVIFAINLSYEIVRQAELLKCNKDKYELQRYIQDKYGV